MMDRSERTFLRPPVPYVNTQEFKISGSLLERARTQYFVFVVPLFVNAHA